MKTSKLFAVSIMAIMAVGAAHAQIASTEYVDEGLELKQDVDNMVQEIGNGSATQYPSTAAVKAAVDAASNTASGQVADLQSQVSDIADDLEDAQSDIEGLKTSKQDKIEAGTALDFDADGKTLNVKLYNAIGAQTDGAITPSAVNGLKTTVESQGTRLGEVETKAANNATEIAKKADASTMTTELAKKQDKLTDTNFKVAGNGNAVDSVTVAADGSVTLNKGATFATNAELGNLNATVTQHGTDITALQAKDTTHDSQIKALQEADTTINGKITNLEAASATHATKSDIANMVTHTGKVGDGTHALMVAENGAITASTTELATATDMKAAKESITEMQTDIGDLQDTTDELSSKIQQMGQDTEQKYVQKKDATVAANAGGNEGTGVVKTVTQTDGKIAVVKSTVATGDIADKAVTTDKLNDGAVTNAKVAANAIKNANIASDAAIALNKIALPTTITNNATNGIGVLVFDGTNWSLESIGRNYTK